MVWFKIQMFEISMKCMVIESPSTWRRNYQVIIVSWRTFEMMQETVQSSSLLLSLPLCHSQFQEQKGRVRSWGRQRNKIEVQAPSDKWYDGNGSHICGNSKEQFFYKKEGAGRSDIWTAPWGWGHSRQSTKSEHTKAMKCDLMGSPNSPAWLVGRSAGLRVPGARGRVIGMSCEEVWAWFHRMSRECCRGRTGRCWEGIIEDRN